MYVLQVEEDDDAMVEPLVLSPKSRSTQRPALKLETSFAPQQGLSPQPRRPQPSLTVQPPAGRPRSYRGLSRSISAPPTPRSQNNTEQFDRPPSRSPSAATRPIDYFSCPTNPLGSSTTDAVYSKIQSNDISSDSARTKTSAISRSTSDIAGSSTGHSSYSSSYSDQSKASAISHSTSLSSNPPTLQSQAKSLDPLVSPVESNLTPKIRQLIGADALSPSSYCPTPLSASLPCSPDLGSSQYSTIKTVEDLSLPPKLRQLIGLRSQPPDSVTPWARSPKFSTVDEKRIPKSPASAKGRPAFPPTASDQEATSPTSIYSQASQVSGQDRLLHHRRRRSTLTPLNPLSIVNEESVDNQDDDISNRLNELVQSPGFAKIQPQAQFQQQSGKSVPELLSAAAYVQPAPLEVAVQSKEKKASARELGKKRDSQALGLQVYHDWAVELAKSSAVWEMEGSSPPSPAPPQVSMTPRTLPPASSPKAPVAVASNRGRHSSATNKLSKSPAQKPPRSSETESRATTGHLKAPKPSAARNSARSSFSLRSKKPPPQISVFDEDSESDTDTLAAFHSMVRSVGGRKASTSSPPTSPKLLQNLIRGVRRRTQSDNQESRNRSKSRPRNGPMLAIP